MTSYTSSFYAFQWNLHLQWQHAVSWCAHHMDRQWMCWIIWWLKVTQPERYLTDVVTYFNCTNIFCTITTCTLKNMSKIACYFFLAKIINLNFFSWQWSVETYCHMPECDYRLGLDWCLDTLIHALLSVDKPSVLSLGIGFQQRTFPFLLVSQTVHSLSQLTAHSDWAPAVVEPAATQVQVTLRPKISRPVRLGVGPPMHQMTRFYISFSDN
jgi:hypothetical protein